MMTEKLKELICTPCALQFDKKVVFDLHISLVHETAKSESGETLSAIEENQDFASEAIQTISCKVWQYGFSSFQVGDTNLERFFPKD